MDVALDLVENEGALPMESAMTCWAQHLVLVGVAAVAVVNEVDPSPVPPDIAPTFNDLIRGGEGNDNVTGKCCNNGFNPRPNIKDNVFRAF